ncbi:tetratricopeptide repeat protein 38-like [Bolinopsis microptera]|uniref:tetratricopeptide repeat protein 38-like n=1 Tax=Bolinopsis microptera TaxID=2820187 RepID=UPI003078F14E
MVNFRSEWRDLAGWAPYNLPLNTSSNQAAKLYDAALDQLAYYYNDPVLDGVGETMVRMLAEDPSFVAGNLLKHSMELFGSNSDPARVRFDEYCGTLDMAGLNHWETEHIAAVRCFYKEDLIGAMEKYSAISRQYPYDLHSFNFGYVLGLINGKTSYLRDVPLGVVERYKPHMPHYGLVHGKLCFGHAEMGEYEEAKRCGDIALEAFPLDSWAVHAMAHTYENQSKPKEVVKMLDETSKHWTRGVCFSQHIHWHQANAHTQLGEYEAALTIYDTHVGHCARGGDVFPLSDASSLLMRLKVDGQKTGGREEILADLWSQHNDEFTSLFYDGHSAIAAAMVGDTSSLDTLLENMREFVAGDRSGWNKVVTSTHGVELVEGIRLMSGGDYTAATDKLLLCVPGVIKMMHGSKAQKSIFSIVLMHCALLSGTTEHLCAAEQHMKELMAWNKVSTLPPLQQRLWDKIQLQHSKH